MDLPKRAGDKPVEADLEKGKTYAWCACGLSKTQPFCDGSHKVTDIKPFVFVSEETKKSHLCMCKQTKNKPYCDGSHNK
jgi:CDGSH-type Zn-finger protein